MIIHNQLQKWAKNVESDSTHHKAQGLHRTHQGNPDANCIGSVSWYSCHHCTGTFPMRRSAVGK